MIRKLHVVLFLVLALALMTVPAAFAAGKSDVVKFNGSTDYLNEMTADVAFEGVEGKINYVYPKSKTEEVKVSLSIDVWGLVPYAEYLVSYDDGAGFGDPESVFADEFGKLSWDVGFLGAWNEDPTSAVNVDVLVETAAGDDVIWGSESFLYSY